MKKYNRKISLIAGLTVAAFINLNAQNFQGIATYQSSRSVETLFGKNYKPVTVEDKIHLQQHMQDWQKEYELKFNLTESAWKKEESLQQSDYDSSPYYFYGMKVLSGVIYKNTAEKRYLHEQEVRDKPFLVADALVAPKWKTSKEYKKIGDYTAYKATYTETRKRRVFSEESENKMKTETYTVEIEAWYTLDIPVPHGPREYWGLPGLILQVSDGTMTYLCTKVVLNPEKGIRIKKPRRGKKITAEQFDTEIAKASESTIKQQAPSKPGSENTHY